MSKEKNPLIKVHDEIRRLEGLLSNKSHGPDSNELKILEKLNDLYRKRRMLEAK